MDNFIIVRADVLVKTVLVLPHKRITLVQNEEQLWFLSKAGVHEVFVFPLPSGRLLGLREYCLPAECRLKDEDIGDVNMFSEIWFRVATGGYCLECSRRIYHVNDGPAYIEISHLEN